MARERRIAVAGAPNFRDLGGYEAADGKTVKWGMVFRSDDLSDLTFADMEVVASLGIRTVVDFRDRQEVLYSPDVLPKTVAKSVNIPIEAGRIMGSVGEGRLTRKRLTGVMISVYRALAHDFQPSFREFFGLLANPDGLPLLFHCTAGKDRTGFAAALFLSALGVDKKTIFDDYLLSNACLLEKYVAGVDYDEEMQPLYSVDAAFLNAAFDVIESGFGGVEKYLSDNLEVDIAHFRATFTE